MLEQLINLLRRRPRAEPPPTPYVSFRLEGTVKSGAVIWVLDRRLNERSRYEVYWN